MVRLGKLSQVNRTPEQRVEQGRKAAAARKTHGGRRAPNEYTQVEWDAVQALARQDVKRIMKIMDEEGILPEDPLAREALKTALELMRSSNAAPLKHAVLRTILEYRLAKPTAKSEVTVKTAEDWLDQLAAEEKNGDGD